MKSFLKKAAKLACFCLAVLTGIAAALWIHGSFMLVKIEGTDLMPLMKPGQVAAVNLTCRQEFEPGDLVALEPDYYHVDGQGQIQIWQVAGIRGNQVELCGGSQSLADRTAVIKKEDILGKVVYYG